MSTIVQDLTPVRIFGMLNAYQASFALKAAIETELFTAIDDGNHTAAQIAGACHTSERGMRILCDFLTIQEMLTKDGDDYALTRESATFLSKRSPTYIGSISDFLVAPDSIQRFQDLTTAVREGGSGTHDGGAVSESNPIWVTFARAMKPLLQFPARYLAQAIGPLEDGARVLDIAAGHGMFGITVAQMNPGAQVAGQDSAEVLAVASENAAIAGVSERYSTIPGDAFEVDFGGLYDVVLIPNFLHHFSQEQNVELLSKVHSALKPDGRVAIMDFVPEDDRISPPVPASFTLTMLAATPEGDTYTFSQLRQMLKRAGFQQPAMQREADMPQALIIARA